MKTAHSMTTDCTPLRIYIEPIDSVIAREY